MATAKVKKRFFEVEIPILNKTTHLQAFDISELEGRFIKYDLTRELKGKNIFLSLKVGVKDSRAVAIPREISLVSAFLRKLIRKGTNCVEDSFLTECTDAVIKLKTFLVTRRKVSRVVRKELRNKSREKLISYVKDKEYEEISREILKGSLQRNLSSKLKKIYPLSACEIKYFKVEQILDKTEKEKNSKKEKSEEKKEEIEISQE